MINHRKNIKKDQEGFVAFFVTIMVMIIFGILIISFSQISNKENTNSLNRNLSTEALYTAESGINDAYSTYIKSGTQQTSSCSPSTYGYPALNTNTQYTCVLVSSTPGTLEYQCLSPSQCPNSSVYSFIESGGSLPINQLTINWADSTKTDTGCPTVTPSPFLSAPGTSNGWPTSSCPEVLRIDLVPFTSGTTTLSSLESSVKTFFLYPQPSANATQIFSTISNGAVYSATCSTSSCSFSVNDLSAVSSSYYIRVQYYYGTPLISFTGQDIDGNSIQFADSQVEIDATGVSGTILKRVSAYIGLHPSNVPYPPNYALQSTATICKSFLWDQTENNIYEIIPNPAPGDISSDSPGIGSNPLSGDNTTDFCNPI